MKPTHTLVLLGFCATVHAQGRTGSASPGQDSFDSCVRDFEGNDFEGAAQKCKEAIQLDAALVGAYTKLGAALYNLKKYPEAVSYLRKCPDQVSVDVREYLGVNLYKAGAQAEAVTILEGVAKDKPQSVLTQLQLGNHYAKVDPKKAIAAFEAYTKYRANADPVIDQAVHEKLGTLYLVERDWDSAQREFEGLLKTKQNELSYKLGLGVVYVAKSECSKAIALYERILADATKQPSIYYNLGTCYLKSARGADAQRELELYTRAKPNDIKGQLALGDAYFDQHNLTKALAGYLTAERLDQTSGAVKTRLGRTYVAQKNYTAALSVLEMASKAAPNDSEVLGELAEVYAATNQSKDKLNAIAGKLSALTKDAKAQSAAGVAYWAAGNDEAAGHAYRNAIALEPTNLGAKRALAKVLNRRAQQALEKNESAHALAQLREANELVPDDLMTSRNLGLVLLMAKKFPEAEEALKRPLGKVPDDMILNRLMGRALLGQSKREAALAAYERAAKIALRVRGLDLAGVYAELGPLYLEDPAKVDTAVTVLEQALKEAAASPPLQAVAQRNLGIAYFRRGTARLRDPKDAEGALEDIVKANQVPKGSYTTKEMTALACGEAFAALKAGKIPQAEEAFARGGSGCQVRPPYDKLGVQLFAAYASYRDQANAAKREAACKTFQTLQAKASGVAGEWVKLLQRSCWENVAYDYFQRSDERRSEQFLKNARKVAGRGETRDLEHNQAVLDMLLGRTNQAEKSFEAMGARPAEALMNLGIIRDRQGEAKKALELYKRAFERGARAPKLKEWIDVKERLFEVKS